MRLPIFRLRTLMFVVAVAALECWLLVNDTQLGILFILFIGPLIGSLLLGNLSNKPHYRHVALLLGGILGGAVETGVLVLVLEGLRHFRGIEFELGPDIYSDLFIANVIVGFGVGLTLGAMHSLRLAIVSPACIVEDSAIQVAGALVSDGETGQRCFSTNIAINRVIPGRFWRASSGHRGQAPLRE